MSHFPGLSENATLKERISEIKNLLFKVLIMSGEFRSSAHYIFIRKLIFSFLHCRIRLYLTQRKEND